MNKKLAEIATTQVGVKEQGGNNTGPKIVEYQKATWLTPAAWPWCAAFVAWCLREALRDIAFMKALGLKDDETFSWRCRDASAFGWIKWAQNKGLYVTDEKELAKAGDIVVFDFSHIGIVEKDQLKLTEPITCIEGNTNVKGERDSTSGDGVWRKVRNTNTVRAYIRIIK